MSVTKEHKFEIGEFVKTCEGDIARIERIAEDIYVVLIGDKMDLFIEEELTELE